MNGEKDILKFSHVSKSFGANKILCDLSFCVPAHSVFGFVGQNGAGKTTAMKLLLGLLKADCGEIFVDGEKVRYGQTHTNRLVGYLPDVPEFYGFLTPMEYLTMCGRITGMDRDTIHKKSKYLLDLVGLCETKKRIHGFSRGMKQRLGIAQALLNSPKLLICDEPTSALDPAGRREILDILNSVREHTTVLFSTHILSDIERICDHIAFLHKGRIVLCKTMEELRTSSSQAQSGSTIFPAAIEVECFCQSSASLFSSQFPDAVQTGPATFLFSHQAASDLFRIMGRLSENHIPVRRLESLRSSTESTIEDLFLQIIGEQNNDQISIYADHP